MRRFAVLLAVAVCAALLAGEAAAVGKAQVPGLQVALYRYGHYKGPIDGIPGPMTRQAVIAFQRSAGLPVDGVAGPQTLAALGPLGRPLFGSRLLHRGHAGFDVSVLQFLLARQGFATESLNSTFGGGTEEQVRRFQRSVGLTPDGIVGTRTRAALLAPPRNTRHLVRPGETLTSIAARSGTTVEVLLRRNGLQRGQVLLAGTTLVVPLRPTRPRST
jgi:peptidoglycan hydrolase-like protein with peptidoglycan-binding domain